MKTIATTLLLALIFFAQPLAAAPVVPEWATWELELAFEDSEIFGSWHITIGTDLAGNRIPLHQETIMLNCWAMGDVNLDDNYAKLQDGGHINCMMPDFSKTVDEIISREFGPMHVLNLPATCNCQVDGKLPLTVQAKADFATVGEHPLVAHPNFDFAVETDGKYARQQLDVNGLLGQSIWQLAQIGLHEYLSTYSCDGLGCAFVHYLNSIKFDSESVDFEPLWLDNDATIITFGQGMTGNLHNVQIDPGCFAG